jgi:hypothetical protein
MLKRNASPAKNQLSSQDIWHSDHTPSTPTECRQIAGYSSPESLALKRHLHVPSPIHKISTFSRPTRARISAVITPGYELLPKSYWTSQLTAVRFAPEAADLTCYRKCKCRVGFSCLRTFNFHGWNDAPDVLEPLLFYVLHRASNEITDPEKLGTFKIFLLDEAWLFIKNETIRVQAQKTWRKHKAAMILATQSIKELEESGMLAIVAESCPTKIFLANPDMNREVYREAFHLNDTELGLIDGLIPPGQMPIRKSQTSKKVHLNVDSVSHWMATNNARDNLKKQEYFDRHGFANGRRHLAEEYPFQPRALASDTTR